MSRANDTFYGMPWDGFKRLVSQHGFTLALVETFEDRGFTEELAIWGYRAKGLLIVAGSYRGVLNQGTVYGQARRRPHYKAVFPVVVTGNYIGDVYAFSLSQSDGLFRTIKVIERDMELLPTWEARSFLWMVHYTEEREPNFDYVAITDLRLARCPDWLQDLVARR